MSFFEYQYGERRVPKGAYALCCHALRQFYDRQGGRLTANDPDDYSIPISMRKIPRREVQRRQLMSLHNRLIENRITSGKIADGCTGEAFCSVIFEHFTEDLSVLGNAIFAEMFRNPPWEIIFPWIYASRRNLAYLMKYVRILYLIVDIKYNITNETLMKELRDDLRQTMEMNHRNFIAADQFFEQTSKILGE